MKPAAPRWCACATAASSRARTRARSTSLRTFGNSGHEVWDVTEPAKPERVTVVVSGLRQHPQELVGVRHRHRAISSRAIRPGARRRMTKIYDLSDPAHPVFIRDFGLPGQQPGSTGPVPTELARADFARPESQPRVFRLRHRRERHRADRRSREAPERTEGTDGREPALPADHQSRSAAGCRRAHRVPASRDGRRGVRHAESRRSAVRAPPAAAGGHDHEASVPANQTQARRDFIAVVGETIANECNENRQMLRMLDATVETRPFGASSFTVPESSRDYLQPRRALRHAFLERELHADLLQARAVPRALQRRRARRGHPRSVQPEGDRRTTFRPSPARPTSGASARARTRSARSRSRPTTSRSTTAATSTSSIAPTPACTFSSSPARPEASPGFDPTRSLTLLARMFHDPAYG